ncbi:MAG: LL-diaminopimelate aminotransferase [Polyangiaceae bacterium]|nr:LL-diaminopimelate aminotransferase [Polyangiaceae bacterium]
MARTNPHYDKLAAGYLFPEIARRAQAFAAENPGVRLHRLGIGDTTEPLVPAVIAGLHQGVERLATVATYTGYGDYEGDPPIREAIARLYRRRGVALGLDEIFVSDGAKPDSGNIQSVFAPDSVVAVQDPAYPVYVDTNVIAGRTGPFDAILQEYGGLVYMPCRAENRFFPELPTKAVDLIYICSPNNPTGAVATHADLARFVAFARQRRAVIVFDAAYSAFIKDPSLPRSIFEVEGARECALEIHSLSKTAGFTGVRLGWTIVPRDLVLEDGGPGKVNRLWRRRQSTFFNGPSNVVQAGGVAALSDAGLAECQIVIDYYLENARIIRSTLTSLGLTCYGGDNAPYVWLETPGRMNSWEFFDRLLREANVIVTPGSGFGPSGEGYVRLSSFGHREDVEAAAASIRDRLRP